MPTPRVREILENLANTQRCNYGNPEDYIEMSSIYEAEKQLAEWVRSKKIEIRDGIMGNSYAEYGNEVLESLAKSMEEEA